jgi:bifunctional non-homologous end joining protein LigD
VSAKSINGILSFTYLPRKFRGLGFRVVPPYITGTFVSTGVQRRPPSGFIQPRLPTASDRPRTGPEWVHEIKHDGYRLMARRTGDRVRLFTRRGYDWSDRYPRIVSAMRALKTTLAMIDGEAVWCGPDGAADFDKLHSRAHDDEVFMYAFDLLELDGEDLRARPLEERKAALAKLIGSADGLQFSEHLEGDGKKIFKHICKMGLEGIVSKRRDFPYISGRSKAWIKVRNPASEAMLRYQQGTF